MHVLIIPLLVVGLSMPVVVQAKSQASINQCQSYKDTMDRYQAKRRKGGSGSQMSDWKKKIRAADEKYRAGNCRKHRWKLD